ncbi:hypothetical protein Pint_22867 [Pistacia integerrima]|uniref:Uncharacterized protein n=1 Tax=Pistacia integerrima TaxID=434235 RepID=A0ACC0YN58_9ROSI|nr:hypothetical protein Pint_22867 [Pistacia integerrima]
MFHSSPQNHHMKQYQNGDTPIALPVYPAIQKPLPNKHPKAQQYPYGEETFNDEYGGFILANPVALPVYPTIRKPKPHRLPEAQYSYGNETFNDKYGGFMLVNPRGIRAMQYEQAPNEMQYQQAPVHHAKAKDHNHKVKENVDSEAEEFIKLEHNKFKINKTMESFDY